MPKNIEATHPQADLLRFVQSPDGVVMPDIHMNLPCDNPLYIGAFPLVMHKAMQHGVIAQHFGGGHVRDDMVAHIATLAEKAALQTIAMANKSGNALLGREAVTVALDARETECVIIATDAGGADKRALLANPLSARYCHIFSTRTELGRLVRRRAQVYLAIREGALSQKCQRFLSLHTRFSF